MADLKSPFVSPPSIAVKKTGPALNVGSGGPQRKIANGEDVHPAALSSVLDGVTPSQGGGNPIGVGSVAAPGRPFRV